MISFPDHYSFGSGSFRIDLNDHVEGFSASTRVEPGGEVIVSLAGEVDLSNIDRFSAVLGRLLDCRTGDVVIDMGPLKFISADAMRLVVSTAEALWRRRRTTMRVRNPNRLQARLIGLVDDHRFIRPDPCND